MGLHGQDPPGLLPHIREAWLDTKELPSGLGSGSWSIVPRSEFLSVYHRAKVIAEAQQRPPWLLEAHYQGRFAQHQLHGTAVLTIHNPHAVPAVARLTPWTVTPSNSTDAKLIGLGERTLGTEVDPGRTSVRTIAWSLQGEQRGDGTWFTLQLPAAPLATFDVTLPPPIPPRLARRSPASERSLPGGIG